MFKTKREAMAAAKKWLKILVGGNAKLGEHKWPNDDGWKAAVKQAMTGAAWNARLELDLGVGHMRAKYKGGKSVELWANVPVTILRSTTVSGDDEIWWCRFPCPYYNGRGLVYTSGYGESPRKALVAAVKLLEKVKQDSDQILSRWVHLSSRKDKLTI